ncbi:MAG: TIGR00282 family metallophosphoesterase [Planctomycetales bacterium]|nr:TIGR00282 family metallophosphoesterase [Planctomycetales bacterium]MBN8626392.1 TIGR00282 family metallophosphoesterase [Planctomycetota bacterium]
MRLLFIGDVVGKPGRKIIQRALPGLIVREKLDLVVVNGENSAAGSGITPEIYRELLAAGADCITLGDHIYKRREILPTLEQETKIVKPANFPARSSGREYAVVQARDNTKVAVISLLGRVFMRPVDCPWAAVDRVLAKLPSDIKVIFVDFHAEATSDKQVMGRYLDGRVSAVLGTHTHVPTADEEIFPKGTAFQCDVGMTGPYLSILGREINRVTETTLSFAPTQFDVANDDVRLCGSIVDIDASTGRAKAIRRLRVDMAEAEKIAFEQQTPGKRVM